MRPATIRRSVLLPQPDGPRRLRNSPLATARSTPPSASSPEAKRFLTLRNCTTGRSAIVVFLPPGQLISRPHNCHPGAGRDPFLPWIPACAGMTECFCRKCCHFAPMPSFVLGPHADLVIDELLRECAPEIRVGGVEPGL